MRLPFVTCLRSCLKSAIAVAMGLCYMKTLLSEAGRTEMMEGRWDIIKYCSQILPGLNYPE